MTTRYKIFILNLKDEQVGFAELYDVSLYTAVAVADSITRELCPGRYRDSSPDGYFEVLYWDKDHKTWLDADELI